MDSTSSSVVSNAPTYEERPARLAVEILLLMPCPATPAGLAAAARGSWRARTGVLRSTALAGLARGQRDGIWQSEDLDQLIEQTATESNELIRAAALAHVLATASDEDRPALLAAVASDPSPLVRRLLAVEDLVMEPSNDQP